MTPLDGHRWLLLVHQLPSKPSNLRVRVWRRLQAVGAVLVKNSVYVLPNSSETREDFEWIRGEVATAGGEALLFSADTVDDLTTEEIVDAFVTARREDWNELAHEATALAERRDSIAGEGVASRTERERELKALRNRIAQLDKIDYFQAPGRDAALEAIDALGRDLRPERPEAPATIASQPVEDYRRRRWLTRPRPGVDRMASAWLIRRFVDPEAEFLFGEEIPTDELLVPFDMFGVEFGHHGNLCTFETLLAAFELEGAPLATIARIVHDLDLRSESPTDSETSTIGRLISGLRAAISDDDELLDRGMLLFEALYQSFRSESSST